MQNDTIAAISTPPGVGAVGIVRMSGVGARDILSRLWISEQHPVDKFVTHRLYYGKMTDLSTDKSVIPSLSRDFPHVIDNVLAVWMASPHSYTGEDVVEIHCHGGSISTKSVLNAVLHAGARLAFPGEFTRRAFLNGRMDLAQAEAVAEIINASSERAYRLAHEQLEGRLSTEIKNTQNNLKEVKAFVEAAIDFPEEDIEFIEHEHIAEKIRKIKDDLFKLSSTYNEGRMIHDGVRVVIVGKPNVGKSSILNAFLGDERAIVHHMPGTTRDIIEEAIEIGGIAFRLIDTAGMRDSLCEIERLGIDRARIKLSEADLALVVIDASMPVDDEDKKIIDETKTLNRLFVFNKTDLINPPSPPFEKGGRKAPLGPRPFTGLGGIYISAKIGTGLDKLKEALVKLVSQCGQSEPEGVIITNLRHKKAIDDAGSSLDLALSSVELRESAEFTACHLQSVMDSLGKVTGAVTSEDVLNEIFTRFCIGK